MYLPHDIVFDILSWLPVKSLLRFKCVCKTWCSIIEDPMFIHKHLEQSPFAMVHEEELDTKFTIINQTYGLILERHKSYGTYRLRNLATRQILDLPEETKGIPELKCYIPSTNELKVIYVHSPIQGNYKEVLTYNVLRVGTTFTWKSLVSPLVGDRSWYGPTYPNPKYEVCGTTFYGFRKAGDIYIDCLDLENDSLTTIKTPPDLFSKKYLYWILTWEDKISFADIEQNQLNIRVLESYKNHKWIEKKIVISVKCLSDYHQPSVSPIIIQPVLVKGNLVHCRNRHRNWFFTFDTQSKQVEWYWKPQSKDIDAYQPCLIPLH